MIAAFLLSVLLHAPVPARVVLLQGHTTCGTLTTNEVCVGGVFTIAADASDADAILTTDYALFKNGAQVATVLVSTRVAGVVSFPGQTLSPAGSYTYRLDARGPGGTASATLIVVAKGVLTAPNPPTLLRIIRIGQ